MDNPTAVGLPSQAYHISTAGKKPVKCACLAVKWMSRELLWISYRLLTDI